MTNEITLHPTAECSVYGKSYDVHLNGEKIGSVYQSMVAHDRKSRGSRIVTRRTQSLRWFNNGSGTSWDWKDTRWEAIARLLAHVDGTHEVWNYEDIAKAARVVKEA